MSGDQAVGDYAGRPLSRSDQFYNDIQTIIALAQRDILSRFGSARYSYVWAYLTPLIWILATFSIFFLLNRRPPVFTDTISFILSGMIPYVVFRYTVTGIERSVSALRGLVIFPTVTTEHGVIAAALVEFTNVFIVYVFLTTLNFLIFGNFELDKPLKLLEGLVLAWGLGASIGYMFATFIQRFPGLRYATSIALRPTFLFSGVFYTASELPDDWFKILQWNPMLHAIDTTRDGMLFHYDARVTTPIYPAVCIVIFLIIGVLIRPRRY